MGESERRIIAARNERMPELSGGEKELKGDILSSRPPLPVGCADISEIVEQFGRKGDTVSVYSWLGLPRWLEQIEEAFSAHNKPIVCLNVCSSIPMYDEQLRGRQFDRDRVRAQNLVGELYGNEAIAATAGDFNLMLKVSARDELGRKLLLSAVQKCLYTIT